MFFSRDIAKKTSIKGPLVAIVSILVVAFVIILVLTVFIIPKNQEGVLYESENVRTWTFGDSGISLVTEITEDENGNISWKRFVKCPDGSQIPWGAGENMIPEDFYFRFAIRGLDETPSLTSTGDIIYFTREGRVERPCGCEK